VLSNGEVPPLKKLQPGIHEIAARNVSPMSTPTLDAAPLRHNAGPNGSCFRRSEPNPKGELK